MFGLGALTLAACRSERATALTVIACVGMVLFAAGTDIRAFLWPWRQDIGAARHVTLTARTTTSGLRVYVPEIPGSQIWNAPLPSTPWFNPALRLRRAGDLSKGFVIDRSGTP
jgi:hypothetical protein